MVVGDVIIGDGMMVVGEGDSFTVGPVPDMDYEITNIYISGPVVMHMIRGGGANLSLGTLTESQFGINIHLDAEMILALAPVGVDDVTIAVDGIVTRRPPTVFA